MRVLGFSAFFHDSAAALVVDGRVLAAAEEERFNREQHTKRFPSLAIRYCLAEGGVGPEDLDAVAFFLDAGPTVWRGLGQALGNSARWMMANLPTARNALRWARGNPVTVFRLTRQFRGALRDVMLWPTLIRRELGLDHHARPAMIAVPHHLAHIGGSYLISGFDDAAILIADGRGEVVTTTLAVGQGRRVQILKELSIPHSLGYMYGGVTGFLGFRPGLDEGKVMGLAPYGSPRFAREFEELLRLTPDGLFRLDTSRIDYTLAWSLRYFTPGLVRFLGLPRAPSDALDHRHADIARSLQERLEHAMASLSEYLERRVSTRRLCLAGGVAMNSVANGRIAAKGPWRAVYTPPAPGDAGAALGAAVWATAQGDQLRSITLPGAYLGPAYGADTYRAALREAGLPHVRSADVAEAAARLLSSGHILGWFQGRMELGPRALGNRSTLADPRTCAMRDRVNTLKGRELWRPLAPSVKAERMVEWFVEPGLSPYMSFVKTVRPEVADRIAACVHVDGTARVQTVKREDNPLYWALLDRFERHTGVPCVLNTSFNRRSEPIVCTPRDAVRSFLAMGLDYLVLGDFVAARDARMLESVV